MPYLADESVGNFSLWKKEEVSILREMFKTVEWRANRGRWRIRPSFLQCVQQEMLDRLQVHRSCKEIHSEIRRELQYRQESRAMRIVKRFLAPTESRSTGTEFSAEKIPKHRKEKWGIFIKDQIRYQPMHDDTPYTSYFAAERRLLEAFTIPLNEIASDSIDSQPQCPVRCSFIRLMGVSCAESLEIYHYALAVSAFLLKNPAITIREIGEQFVERYPRARPLMASPLVLDYIIESLCAMLDVPIADASG